MVWRGEVRVEGARNLNPANQFYFCKFNENIWASEQEARTCPRGPGGRPPEGLVSSASWWLCLWMPLQESVLVVGNEIQRESVIHTDFHIQEKRKETFGESLTCPTNSHHTVTLSLLLVIGLCTSPYTVQCWPMAFLYTLQFSSNIIPWCSE